MQQQTGLLQHGAAFYPSAQSMSHVSTVVVPLKSTKSRLTQSLAARRARDSTKSATQTFHAAVLKERSTTMMNNLSREADSQQSARSAHESATLGRTQR